jgi:hypothetical protein
MEPENVRILKVYYLYRERKRQTVKSKRTTAPFPMIRLSGNYLEEAGFAVGDSITVTLEKNKISISKDLPSETEPGSAEAQPVEG